MIKIEGVSKSFESTVAIYKLTVEVEDGSVFGLVGSNGAGKSTLLRMIAGVYKPDSGSITIDGTDPFENVNVKSNTLFISDYPYFESGDTVDKIAKRYKQIYPNWSDEKFEQFRGIFPIKFSDKISTMSKGMQRQAAVILGLSAMPRCILFDEIFDGLDPVVRELVKRILIEYVEENNACVVIASHNLRELEDVCDHVALLHKGGALLDDEIDKLKLGVTRIQFALNNPDDFENVRPKLNIIKLSNQGKIFELTVRGDREKALSVIESLNPLFTETLPLTLEELFISEMEAAGYDIDNLIK